MTMPEVPSGFSVFNYSEEVPNAWQGLMDQYRSAALPLRAQVFWGAHESLQGIRDYRKASRLRLERFLTLAQERTLPVELALGFPGSRESLPIWTFSLPTKALVPSGSWLGSPEMLGLTQVPSLRNSTLWGAFLEFLEELMGMLALYGEPGGPLRDIELDFGVYDLEQSVLEDPGYPAALQARHQTIGELNLSYGTNFKDFASTTSVRGYKVLLQKRPWLAAFDYKWCRNRLLAQRRADALRLIPHLSRPKALGGAPNQSWRLALDPVLFESSRELFFPFTPGACVHETAIRSFRLAELIAEKAPGKYQLLPFDVTDPCSPVAPTTVVFCGKYLARAAFQKLEAALHEGARLVFPLELPLYDELLSPFDWGNSRDRVPTRVGAVTWLRAPSSHGEVWLTGAPVEVDEALWESFLEVAGEREAGGAV